MADSFPSAYEIETPPGCEGWEEIRATSVIKTGQKIRVDGSTGVVTIVDGA